MSDLRSADAAVAALVVLDGASAYPDVDAKTRILVGVRDPKTNNTHPNVVSVPTARIPSQLLAILWPRSGARVAFGYTLLQDWAPRKNGPRRGADPVIYLVESILTRKLGLSDALERGQVEFDAGPVAATDGWSHYAPEDIPASERLTMVSVVVLIRAGAEQVPARTGSYSHIRWVEIARFIEAVQAKDPAKIGIDPVELCIHGLCIRSAYDILAVKLGHPPFANKESEQVTSVKT
jgi:hypothetical protein